MKLYGDHFHCFGCGAHGDVIDLMREDIAGFDVREFYIELVHGLKKRGL